MTDLRYLSTKEAAAVVGVVPNTMYQVVARGEIRWINIGTEKRPRIRIAEADLRAWMDSRASSSAA